MIKLQVIGNLGRDCTVNNVNGRTVINFSIAHTERFRDSASGELKPRTTWVECAYWTDKTAVAPYLKKGALVYAEGTPDTRFYQTQDGTSKASLTLRIQTVQLLGTRTGDGNVDAPTTSHTTSAAPTSATPSTDFTASTEFEGNDDLPF